MTDILALDLATTTGWARGIIGERPRAGTVRFGKADASANAIFAHCLSWMSHMLAEKPVPDLIIVERMLPPQAKRGKTSTDVRDRLAGLHGIIRAVAHLRGIYSINEASVQDVRQHFIGERKLPRDKAKQRVILRCRQLDWRYEDDNSADALALWDYACCLIDPVIGIKRTPLFEIRSHPIVGGMQ